MGSCRCGVVQPARFSFSTARVRCLAPELEISEFSTHAARVGRVLHMGKRAINHGVERGGTQIWDKKNACSGQGIGAGRHGTEVWSTGAGTDGAELGRVPAGWLLDGEHGAKVVWAFARGALPLYVGALMYVGTAAGLPWVGINGEHFTTWARTGCV